MRNTSLCYWQVSRSEAAIDQPWYTGVHAVRSMHNLHLRFHNCFDHMPVMPPFSVTDKSWLTLTAQVMLSPWLEKQKCTGRYEWVTQRCSYSVLTAICSFIAHKSVYSYPVTLHLPHNVVHQGHHLNLYPEDLPLHLYFKAILTKAIMQLPSIYKYQANPFIN